MASLLEIYQGRDQSFALDLSRGDLEFEPGDITAVAFALKLHGGQTDAEAALRKTLGDGLTLLPETDETIVRYQLDLTAEETAALSPMIGYLWDVVLIVAGALTPVTGLSGSATILSRINYSAT